MNAPPRWSEKQLASDVAVARRLFRSERLSEPLERWKKAFLKHKQQFLLLFDEYGIADPSSITGRQLTEIFRRGLGDALRYLPGPPISEDDLEVLADTPSLSPGRIASDASVARRIVRIIAQVTDPIRFPWIAEGRAPTAQEKAAAILASSALITAQRVSADRRNVGKSDQETAVKRFLIEIGFRHARPRPIRTLADSPAESEFYGECKVGTRKADIVVRLFDGRLMPIECKVSNSAVNSVKRVNNDAAVKSRTWRDEFGKSQVVPTAMLSGCSTFATSCRLRKKGSHCCGRIGLRISASSSNRRSKVPAGA